MATSVSLIDAALKSIYRPDLYEDLTFKKRPFLAMLDSNESFSARDMKWPSLYENPQAVSADFATAQTIGQNSAYSRYAGQTIVNTTKHAVAVIPGDVIAASRSDESSFVRGLKSEIDGTFNALSNRRHMELFGSGWGDIGVIASNDSSKTITLTNPTDIVNFAVGQIVQFAASQHADALRNSGGTLVVASLDRALGTVTFTANLSTVTGLANGDYVFPQKDRQDSATPARLGVLGIEAWIPSTAPTAGDSFNGLDRSTDAVRLAGCRLDGTGLPIEEALLEADALVFREGGALDHFLVNPKTYANIAKALGSRVRYQPMNAGPNGRIGFSSLVTVGQAGDIKIVADRGVPANRIYGLTLDTWELGSDKAIVRLNDDDGNPYLRSTSADSVEVRVVSRCQLFCKAPVANVNIQI